MDDPKTVHAQEERRLFYVALTRAEDRLVLCAKKGTGKKDPTPPGYLRQLTAAKELAGSVDYETIPVEGRIPEIHAAAERSRISEWVTLPALPQTASRRLSASAIESYERCPLSYKLGREWKLPEEPKANLQFGSAMHLALRAYFAALCLGRDMSADEVVGYFLDEFKKAKIDDPTQRRLYEQDGDRQLRQFLESPAAIPQGRIAFLEYSFTEQIAGMKVVGRIDRVDEDDDGYMIVDYKTGRPKSQDFADESLQLSVYALAMSVKKPVKALLFQNLENNSTVSHITSG